MEGRREQLDRVDEARAGAGDVRGRLRVQRELEVRRVGGGGGRAAGMREELAQPRVRSGSAFYNRSGVGRRAQVHAWAIGRDGEGRDALGDGLESGPEARDDGARGEAEVERIADTDDIGEDVRKAARCEHEDPGVAVVAERSGVVGDDEIGAGAARDEARELGDSTGPGGPVAGTRNGDEGHASADRTDDLGSGGQAGCDAHRQSVTRVTTAVQGALTDP